MKSLIRLHSSCVWHMIQRVPILYLSYGGNFGARRIKKLRTSPPTVATFIPLIQRTNLVGRVLKAYNNPNPVLPPVTECGWIRDPETNTTSAVHCLLPPAPDDVLEFVKCGCATTCSKNICSCFKGGVPCTPLCKCNDDECLNVQFHYCINMLSYSQPVDHLIGTCRCVFCALLNSSLKMML